MHTLSGQHVAARKVHHPKLCQRASDAANLIPEEVLNMRRSVCVLLASKRRCMRTPGAMDDSGAHKQTGHDQMEGFLTSNRLSPAAMVTAAIFAMCIHQNMHS